MNKSESIAGLCKALAKAQPLVEGAIKDKTNPHFRSKYADLGAVVDAIKPALQASGLSFTQVVHDAENAAKVETVILHESGEWLSCGAVSVPVSKADAQGFGSALTYARRYSLSAAFGVAPEDDDGNAAAAAKPSAGVIKPTDGAKDSLSVDMLTALDDAAKQIASAFAVAPEEAFAEYDNVCTDLEADEKTYLWSKLDSKVRSAIRKIGAAKQLNPLNA